MREILRDPYALGIIPIPFSLEDLSVTFIEMEESRKNITSKIWDDKEGVMS